VNVLARKVARLERGLAPSACATCEGYFVGVTFRQPAPGDYEPGPDGRKPPLPPDCPRCGRRIPKTYVLPDRATWDAICGGPS
jgi:hypothetical protein